ncbi:MAG: mechanosensitive ion channel family protein [Planctomycetota bacterium]
MKLLRWLLPALLSILALPVLPAQDRAGSAPSVEAPQDPGARTDQTGPRAAATVPVATLEQLVQDLEDQQKRDELLARLRALIASATPDPAAAPGAAGAIESLVAFFNRLGDEAAMTVDNVVMQIAKVPERLRAFADEMGEATARDAFLDQALRTGALLAAALALHALIWFAVQRPRRLLAGPRGDAPPLRPLARSWRLSTRLLLDLLPPIAGIAAVMVGQSIVRVEPAGGTFAFAVVAATALRSVLRALLHAVLAPSTPPLRLVPVGDAEAGVLARSLRRTGALAIYGWAAIVAIRAGLGDPELTDALASLYSLALLVGGTWLVLHFRNWPRAFAATEDAATTDAPERARRRSPAWTIARTIGGFWWLGALVYMFGLYALWISGTTDVFRTALEATAITIAWIAAAVAAYVFVGAGIDRAGARIVAAARSLPTIRRRVPGYLTGARVVAAIALAITALGFAFEAWGLETLRALQTTLVQTLTTTVLGVAAVLFLAFAAIDVTTALTETYLRRKQDQSLDSSKVRTLVPLAQKAVRVVVWTLATLTVLGQLGISLGPILASIGVLGLAVGFGAQALVKDIITGVFILLEDTVSVGDIVSIDGTGGLVEAINIRTIRLRDLEGHVHTIPYSSVAKFTNMTKGFSRYLIECGVAYREDVDEVIALLKELGAELQKDPQFGPNMIEPIEIMGLDRFEDSAVIVRARLITKPGQQWTVGREFNRRLKRAFDERGIEIPFPHRTIYLGEDKEGRSPPLYVANRDGAELAALAVRRGDEQAS